MEKQCLQCNKIFRKEDFKENSYITVKNWNKKNSPLDYGRLRLL